MPNNKLDLAAVRAAIAKSGGVMSPLSLPFEVIDSIPALLAECERLQAIEAGVAKVAKPGGFKEQWWETMRENLDLKAERDRLTAERDRLTKVKEMWRERARESRNSANKIARRYGPELNKAQAECERLQAQADVDAERMAAMETALDLHREDRAKIRAILDSQDRPEDVRGFGEVQERGERG